jgi:short-subunit dehydrogenase
MFKPLPEHFHALITGATGAIAGAFARRLRVRFPRARLTLAVRDPAAAQPLLADLGGEVRHGVVDLTSIDALPAFHADAVAAFGPVHLLVNGAGIMDVHALAKMPWDAAERTLRIDLLAPMRLMTLCVPAMIDAGGGAIINVSSMAGRLPLKGCAYYGAAKAGLAMATDVARAELAGKKIRVIGVYPGPVHSRLEIAARRQYPDTPLLRAIPTGDPDALAQRMLKALLHNRREVIYPGAYKLGALCGGLAGLAPRFTARLSPAALE